MEQNTATYSAALNKATAYCARGEKCEKEVEEKLYAWGVDRADAVRIIEYLTENRYVDNRRYAQAYASDKFRFNHWGRRKIATMLYAKGIDREWVDEALAAIDSERYFDVLTGLLKAKARTIGTGDRYRTRSSLFAFAANRGFEPDLINMALDITESGTPVQSNDE